MKLRAKSFKTKLWLYFMLFAAIIFTVLWLLQTVFLQSFYNRMLIDNTKKTAEMIAENSNSEDITSIIDSASVKNSLLVYVTDTDGELLYFADEYKGGHKREHLSDNTISSDSGENTNGNRIKKRHYLESFRNLPYDFEIVLQRLNDSGDTQFEYTTENFYNYGTYIDYYGTDGKSILYVQTTLDPVGAAVSIIRFQLIWVTLFSLIAGFILAWFIAKSFGRPVAQLSEKAKYLGESNYPEEFQEGFCTELDDLSRKLDKTSDKLIEVRNFQTELLANVSHDLRTPLTMIKGYAELIGDTSWDDEEQCKADIAVIIREADRLTELVNEILEYSELKTGDISHNSERLNLSELTARVCRNFEDLYRGKEETIETHIENSIYVNGTVNRLERAVYNLIDNAFRYTDKSRRVTVRLTSDASRAKIEVTDYGQGIPKSELENIWERYYTFRQRKGRGVSGLGLAIVRQTVDMFGGKCYVLSEEGKGSTFCIELDKC